MCACVREGQQEGQPEFVVWSHGSQFCVPFSMCSPWSSRQNILRKSPYFTFFSDSFHLYRLLNNLYLVCSYTRSPAAWLKPCSQFFSKHFQILSNCLVPISGNISLTLSTSGQQVFALVLALILHCLERNVNLAAGRHVVGIRAPPGVWRNWNEDLLRSRPLDTNRNSADSSVTQLLKEGKLSQEDCEY